MQHLIILFHSTGNTVLQIIANGSIVTDLGFAGTVTDQIQFEDVTLLWTTPLVALSGVVSRIEHE